MLIGTVPLTPLTLQYFFVLARRDVSPDPVGVTNQKSPYVTQKQPPRTHNGAMGCLSTMACISFKCAYVRPTPRFFGVCMYVPRLTTATTHLHRALPDRQRHGLPHLGRRPRLGQAARKLTLAHLSPPTGGGYAITRTALSAHSHYCDSQSVCCCCARCRTWPC